MISTLLVEDNASFRRTVSDVLMSNYPLISVAKADNGEDALYMVAQSRPDIIFMDINLPGENGLEVTRRIKELYSGIEIVILTSHDMPEYREQAYTNGADFYISKGSDTCMTDVLERIEGRMALGRASKHATAN